ncbi:CoA transferase [Phenylobacterium sp.]|uniref:CoA transferase n=1 Tax=Phenylobacterium sp. TaxID=1871053 RepID=UPI00273771F1|nr:CoA transferase [Phenylobacterium sp.]MDP3659407.1 CoA transferase [Phenylobacterium sp.]
MYDLLKGLRIVEASSFVAAPSSCLYLSQMGAEVIRLDNVGGGLDFKRWPLSPGGDSFYWEGLNKGKKSVAIDLSSPAGRELAVAIAAAPGKNAGLLVTNYPADGFLAYDRLKAARGDLICVRVMGWPDGGTAVDYTVNSAVGYPLMTGPLGSDVPVNHVLPAWDLLTGAYAAFAITAAERARSADGQGREVRVSLSDMAAATLANLGQVGEVLSAGADRARMGNDLYGAFGRDFATRDGRRVMVVALTARQWSGLLKVLGIGDAVAALQQSLGVSLKDEEARFTHREALFPVFEAAIGGRDYADLAAGFDANGVCWGPYQSVHQAVTQDARLFGANPMFSTIAHPSGLSYPAPGAPAIIPDAVRAPPRAAPRLGEHTDEVLSQVLGLPAVEIARLHDAGVVAGPARTP